MRFHWLFCTWLTWLVAAPLALLAADAPSPAAGMIKLLDGGRVPAERVGAIVEMVGKRGNADDLAYLFKQALESELWTPEVRLLALTSLAEAASGRSV